MWEPESSRSFKSWQTEVCRRGGLPVWTRVLAHRPCDPGRVSGCHPAVPRSGITSHAGFSLVKHLFDALPKADIANQSESSFSLSTSLHLGSLPVR